MNGNKLSNSRIMKWLEEKVMPVLARIAQNVYLQAIRDAFSSFALPVILTGAIFLIIANPPTGINWGPIIAWENASKTNNGTDFDTIQFNFWSNGTYGSIWYCLQPCFTLGFR
jgi:PTS system IIC component